MGDERVERRLAAILAADVVGYSRLVGIDEEGTLAALKALRKSLIDPKITEHRGRIVKNTGDGALVEFASAVDAVRCAVEIQREMANRKIDVPDDRRIEFRISVNIGDIVIEEGDIFGDGVNIAARLESIAAPGGVCISEDVYRQVRGKLDATFEDIGEQKLKNIVQPLRVYRVRIGGTAGATTGEYSAKLPLPDKPSIAVLAFQNMSGDPEQDYFADGMVEDIITALSHFKNLFVIARNSSFTYKGRAVDVKQVGRELGVRYVLEGSVRKASNRVRITGQLIDAATGAHMWADRFDGAQDDVFELQDRVAMNVVGAIAPKLEQAEIERVKRKPTDNLDAYDSYLRGMEGFHRSTKESTGEALPLFRRSIERDPDFAAAWGMAAWTYVRRRTHGWASDPVGEDSEAIRLARRAVELGKDDAIAFTSAGFVLATIGSEYEAGAALVDRALELNPNLAAAWSIGGFTKIRLGDWDLAIERLTHALRLSPFDPLEFATLTYIAQAHFGARRYGEALIWAQRAYQKRSSFLPAAAVFAANSVLAGRVADARQAVARLREAHPELRISSLRDRFTILQPDHLARFSTALREAGLPE